MSAPGAEKTGPDLTLGVSIDELADGASLGGHVGDDRVLLARQGDELFAIGATCTHYNGPLAEGLIVGDTAHGTMPASACARETPCEHLR